MVTLLSQSKLLTFGRKPIFSQFIKRNVNACILSNLTSSSFKLDAAVYTFQSRLHQCRVRNFLSLCGNATVHFGINTSVKETLDRDLRYLNS